MTNKIKIFTLIIVFILIVSIGIFINFYDFADVHESNNVPKHEEIEKKDKLQKPILELTQDSVELEVGSFFYFEDYILKAEDKYGYNLKDQVEVKEELPTDKPGEYLVTYRLDLEDGHNISKQLKVIIREFEPGVNPN